ncbi:MAG: hypothetical protein ACXWF6_17000, partial [Usitatibacter sp.]
KKNRKFEKSNPMDHPVALHGRHGGDLKATGDPLDYFSQISDFSSPLFRDSPENLPNSWT